MPDIPGRKAAEAAIEWYWKHGVARNGAYAISPVWLRSVYQQSALLRSIENGRAQVKSALGLWGPSQSGKSTLISQFVDQGADATGKGGLLDWNVPTLFSSRADIPSDVVVFNPHNVGADASGCVSRFVWCEDHDVKYPEFPVELHLLNSAQLMHAISAGYLSECQRGESWTVERLEALLEKSNGVANPRRIDRAAFECLSEVLDTLDLLIDARDERFTGLDAGGKWSSLSHRILESAFLLSDKRKVQEFAATLLWDGQAPLTGLYNRLMEERGKLPQGRLFCSLEVAATLVNIESYKIYQSKVPDTSLPRGAIRIKDVIRHLSCDDRGTDVVIGTKFPQRKLFARDEDFGLLQGLVRELVIPLRAQDQSRAGQEASGFQRFMKASDLIDFPGVPLRDQNTKEQLLDLSSMNDPDDARLLTDVLKRGKVASLVNSYSRSLGLDAFMVLVRAGHFATKPQQLHRGLVAWWKSADPSYDVYQSAGRRPPLPFFFNMTFFANIIDKIAQGAVSTGLHPLTEMVKQLDPFASPSVCTMLATTYPQFEEGKIHAATGDAKKAVQSILDDPSFGRRCASAATTESLWRMSNDPDGGVNNLFRVVADAISSSDRQRLLLSRNREALEKLQSSLEDQSPREGNVQCQKDVSALKNAILCVLRDGQHDTAIRDAAAWVSYRLRKLVDVSADDLAPIPPAGQPAAQYEAYVQEQLNKWIESKSAYPGLNELGLRDNALRTRLLTYLAERVHVPEIGGWIRSDLPAHRTREDSRELRRILALQLSNHLTRSNGFLSKHSPLDGNDGVIATIRRWAEQEEREEHGFERHRHSPHFAAVIAPLVRLFEEIAKGGQANRPPQPGDNEAAALVQSVRSCIAQCPA